mmetsp:Transcript_6442/g.15937  ORF Transcript_6442/g.15937 Transcript_6442/m.15937 type:complete len:123 (-) Transcript_6442:2369-2737(-)
MNVVPPFFRKEDPMKGLSVFKEWDLLHRLKTRCHKGLRWTQDAWRPLFPSLSILDMDLSFYAFVVNDWEWNDQTLLYKNKLRALNRQHPDTEQKQHPKSDGDVPSLFPVLQISDAPLQWSKT